jgi:hypothetical protein
MPEGEDAIHTRLAFSRPTATADSSGLYCDGPKEHVADEADATRPLDWGEHDQTDFQSF